MTPAAWSLVALLLAIGLSCTSRINVGVVALALAWPIGASAGLSAETVAASFPASLFLTLAGVSLLFGLAEENGTLGGIITQSAGLSRYDRAWAAVFVACLLGIALYLVVIVLERLTISWHPSMRGAR